MALQAAIARCFGSVALGTVLSSKRLKTVFEGRRTRVGVRRHDVGEGINLMAGLTVGQFGLGQVWRVGEGRERRSLVVRSLGKPLDRAAIVFHAIQTVTAAALSWSRGGHHFFEQRLGDRCVTPVSRLGQYVNPGGHPRVSMARRSVANRKGRLVAEPTTC